jgi:hypothetical protein
MKVGMHDSEAWDTIVRRKTFEELDVGVTYWGYRGSVCHPLKQVQPFARATGDEPVAVFMIRTRSDFEGPFIPAREESSDGIVWSPIRDGITTTGRYALVLRSLQPIRDCVDLGMYEVGIGAHEGTPLSAYFRGRVDKACGRLAPALGEADVRVLAMRAELVHPYAVMLRTP